MDYTEQMARNHRFIHNIQHETIIKKCFLYTITSFKRSEIANKFNKYYANK